MKIKLIILSLIGICTFCSCENQEIDIDTMGKVLPLPLPESGPKASFLDSICRNASKDNPVDITQYVIKSASYDGDEYEGWLGTRPLTVRSGCYEYWNMNFNCYQNIDSLPEGNYLLTVQGYYRHGNSYDDIDYYEQNDTTYDFALLYAQSSVENVSVPFVHTSTEATRVPKTVDDSFVWFESKELDDYQMHLPNTMEVASVAFDNGLYINKLAVNVGADGKLKIGFKKNQKIEGDWCIVDNWRLIYYGNDKPSVLTINTTEAIYEVYGDDVYCSGYFSNCKEAEEVGFIYGYLPDLNLSTGKKIKGVDINNNIYGFIAKDVLEPEGETLYCRSYAKFNGEYYYGNVLSTFINYPWYCADLALGDFYNETSENYGLLMESIFQHVETDVTIRNLPFVVNSANCIRASDDDVEYIVVCDGENIEQKYIYFRSNAVNKSELEKWIVGCCFVSTRYSWKKGGDIIYTDYDIAISSGYDNERQLPYIFIAPYNSVFNNEGRARSAFRNSIR